MKDPFLKNKVRGIKEETQYSPLANIHKHRGTYMSTHHIPLKIINKHKNQFWNTVKVKVVGWGCFSVLECFSDIPKAPCYISNIEEKRKKSKKSLA